MEIIFKLGIKQLRKKHKITKKIREIDLFFVEFKKLISLQNDF